tara:strand:+ start:3952 stop:4458 length:507 start_codon:yes stop_codon:yes gene_type:complete
MTWNEIIYPKCFFDLADELAHLRTFHSKHIYKEGTEKHRGKQEHNISMLGILAELIARHHFEESDLDFEVAKLVDEKPIVGADIILNSLGTQYLIDVKGVKSKSEYLRVNHKAHNNPRKIITHYFFIQPITKTKAKYCWVSHKELNSWEIVESTYTKCYQKKINEKIS